MHLNDSIQIENLRQKISLLQVKVDSLNQNATIKQIQFELGEKQDVINQINDFYDSAWLKLIIVISVLGVIVPIIAGYLQRKNLNDLTESIRKQMNDTFDSRIVELKEFNEKEMKVITQEFKNNISEIEKENKNLMTEIDASTFYLQGRAGVNSNNINLAIQSFFKAAHLWSKTKRPERVKVQFSNIQSCLKEINNKEFIEAMDKRLMKSSISMNLEEYLDYFDSNENIDLFIEELEAVKAQINRIEQIVE